MIELLLVTIAIILCLSFYLIYSISVINRRLDIQKKLDDNLFKYISNAFYELAISNEKIQEKINEYKENKTPKLDLQGIHDRLNTIVTLITNAFPPPNVSEYDFVLPEKKPIIGVSVVGKDTYGNFHQGFQEMKHCKIIDFESAENEKVKKKPFYKKVLECLCFDKKRNVDDIINLLKKEGLKIHRYKVQAMLYKLRKDELVSGSNKEGGYMRIKK